MSLTHDRGDIVFQCDACHATLETNTSNFESARNVLRRERWQPKRMMASPGRTAEFAEWNHRCPDCQGSP